MAARRGLPRAAHEVGQIWAADYDIDVAGRLLDGTTFSGECKWWGSPVGRNVLQKLQLATSSSSYYGDRSRGHLYLLFSRSGFTGERERLGAEDASVRLLGPSELMGLAH